MLFPNNKFFFTQIGSFVKFLFFLLPLQRTIDPFKVNAAIPPGAQNCRGERKMHSECTEKAEKTTLDNPRKADIVQPPRITNQRYQTYQFTDQI